MSCKPHGLSLGYNPHPHDACSIKMNTPEVEQVWTALPESAFTDPNSTLGANFASTVTLVCAPGKS